ncbi:uncharacterized protein LOC105689213 [Athalia rosae]|uniref:uncharacterized protein LOC105689213 n=1 Tax=Athalia rosae TaxID=37344 RepID=UPI0020338A78|nr:uncharacterized protein LOC105689213 [Athalia rosae]
MAENFKQPNVTLNTENEAAITDPSSISAEEIQFYQLMLGDDLAAVRYGRLHCTACDVHIGSAPSQANNMFSHPVLRVLLCAACREFYGDGVFEQGEDATDMFCRWCANGGNLYCCSYCSNTFCNKCIRRNFDPMVRKKIEEEEQWKCFVCNPADLYSARGICWALLQHVKTVTGTLKNDPTLTREQLKEKMDLDDSKCCRRKRKSRSQKFSGNASDEEDETYIPHVGDTSVAARRRISGKSPRPSPLTNGREIQQTPKLVNAVPVPRGTDTYVEEDELPMIPCVQYMVEGDSDETVHESIATLFTPTSGKETSGAPPLQINPIPTANLLKVTSLPPLRPLSNTASSKRKRPGLFRKILPVASPQFFSPPNSTHQSSISPSAPTVKYSPLPIRAPDLPPNIPMVEIPGPPTSPVPTASPVPPVLISKQSSQISLPKSQQAVAAPSPSVQEVKVIEIDSDSDDATPTLANGKAVPVRNNPTLSKIQLLPSSSVISKSREPIIKKKPDRSNAVETEITSRTEEVRALFRMIYTKLKMIQLRSVPHQNRFRATRNKTRRFHLAMVKAIAELTDINDKVIHKYSNWREPMLNRTGQTHSQDDTSCEMSRMQKGTIPLDMICTNSDSESDSSNDYDSDGMYIAGKLKGMQSFQERDTVDVGVGDTIQTADKCVQAFDVIERDYEKCIGHSVLTKVEYDPADGSEILKPVIVPAEYNGKYEEQFIFYLQHREDNEIETDDTKGLPDPNETPLKDLIEANSPFVHEMLESIESSAPNRTVVSDSTPVAEASDGSGKENKELINDGTRINKELAQIVNELSEDLRTSRDSQILAKKHSEHGKKDRRKQVLQQMETSEELDIAVQTLIEEDERSRSSSNSDESVTCHVRSLSTIEEVAVPSFSEDECTIID